MVVAPHPFYRGIRNHCEDVMKFLRLIPVCLAASALMFGQATPATPTQDQQQPAGAMTRAEKRAKAKAKKAAETTSETNRAADQTTSETGQPTTHMSRKSRT